MDIRRLEAQDHAALELFLAQIPEGDRTFFKEDVSDPEVVAEKILQWHRIFGMDRFLLQMSVGTMPHDVLLRSIELFAEKVAPALGWSPGRSESTRRVA